MSFPALSCRANWRFAYLVKPFSEDRRERYFAYVHRLCNNPSFESGRLKMELEERSLMAVGQNRVPWKGSVKMKPFHLNDRMLLEMRIKQVLKVTK